MGKFGQAAMLVLLIVPAWAKADTTEAKCRVKNRHLFIRAEGQPSGSWSLKLNDFSTLSRNETLQWDLEAGSASTVEYKDRFGFPWSLAGSGACAIHTQLKGNVLDFKVTCTELKSADAAVPGFLSPSALQAHCTLE